MHSQRVGPERLVAERVEAENVQSVAYAPRVRRTSTCERRIVGVRRDGCVLILDAASDDLSRQRECCERRNEPMLHRAFPQSVDSLGGLAITAPGAAPFVQWRASLVLHAMVDNSL